MAWDVGNYCKGRVDAPLVALCHIPVAEAFLINHICLLSFIGLLIFMNRIKQTSIKLLVALLLLGTSFHSYAYQLTSTQRSALVQTFDWIIQQAFLNKKSGIQVQGKGVVIKLLSDDLVGGRHQRFILRLASSQTLLIVHNIDIAPRLPGLKVGETVAFYGQYEWNSQGGIVHWTHHDPAKKHISGWLKYNNKYYQ